MSTNPTNSNLTNLLDHTCKTIKYQEKITKLKGEHFNLFSVLDIEARENKTHSNFIAELLDPKGCHLRGSVFLELFLKVLAKEIKVKKDDLSLTEKFINSAKTRVKKEFYIGKRDDKKKTGGRIDIHISNGRNSISLENKIYALDQYCQVERYCNYNKTGNTILYLTLHGEDASEESKGCLEAGSDYFNISYKEHITEWLELCLKEVPNLTSVRESINQYIQLIKKLTHNLNMEQEKELHETMSRYLEEASYIANNYEEMISGFRERFRDDLHSFLKDKFDLDKYTLENGLSVNSKYSQLWININKFDKEEIKYGIESFSGKGHDNGDMFVGLLDMKESEILNDIEPENKKNQYWRFTRNIETKDGNRINLHHMYTIKILANPQIDKYEKMLENVGNQVLEFVHDYEKILSAEVIQEN
jgi:hypothetical protein